ncbi:hypothetical protein DFH11DRAFT_1507601 [Phellopilus nigrolimitatus]|nr:hypothetical protein DFH11DRAFT_1507601 [Phellopilus nigrolimitatus]
MAYGVKSHKFLCCLPVRLGVFVLSFAQFALSGALSALCYFLLFQNKGALAQQPKIATSILAALMSLIALASFLGFIGSLFRRYHLVKIYSRTLNWLLALSVLLGAAALVLLFLQSRATLVAACRANVPTDDAAMCSHINAYRFALVGCVAASWILQLYGCVIVARYAIQLQEEREERWRLSAMKTYTQVPGAESTDAFAHPDGVYGYADKERPYGTGPHFV